MAIAVKVRTAPCVLSVCGSDPASPAGYPGTVAVAAPARGGGDTASQQPALLGAGDSDSPPVPSCRRRNANDRIREDNAEDAVNAPY